MRKRVVRFNSRAEAEALQTLQDKAAGPYPKQPGTIGSDCAALGISFDINTTLRDANGDPVGWIKHERDLAPVEFDLDMVSLSEPTPTEIPDPTERAAETARVNARLARLTAQERATVAQALAQGGGGGGRPAEDIGPRAR